MEQTARNGVSTLACVVQHLLLLGHLLDTWWGRMVGSLSEGGRHGEENVHLGSRDGRWHSQGSKYVSSFRVLKHKNKPVGQKPSMFSRLCCQELPANRALCKAGQVLQLEGQDGLSAKLSFL